MNIIPDLTLTLVQMAPFLVLLVGLHFILFKPLVAYLEEREQATDGARKEAAALQQQAAAALARWEQELAKAQAEVTEFRAGRRQVAQQAYQAIVAEARKQAEARIAEATAQIRAEATAARAGLAPAAQALSADVAAKVIGRPLQPSVEA